MMNSILNLLTICLLQFALAMSANYTQVIKVDLDDHFKQYKNLNITHHDNIDDNIEPHSHTHKHSEDGQEHEHEHEHLKVSQHEILKYQYICVTEVLLNYSYVSKQKYINVIHLSAEHTLEIFRPPIA